MGSFSSTPRIDNPDSQDDDVIGSLKECPCPREALLTRCRDELMTSGRPPLLERRMRPQQDVAPDQAPLRVLQWNVLSQCECRLTGTISRNAKHRKIFNWHILTSMQLRIWCNYESPSTPHIAALTVFYACGMDDTCRCYSAHLPFFCPVP